MLKFTVDQGAFASALSSVVGASAKKSTMPVLQCVRVSADGDLIRLDCTDLDLSLSAGLEAAPDSGVSGSVCVDARHLLQVVSALSGDVTLEVTDTHQVKIQACKAKFTLHGLPLEEFPKLPQVKDATQVVYGVGEFIAALSAATPYCSTDETRYVLNGVLLDLRGCFVATDGHRLVKAPIANTNVTALTRQIIVPAKACQQILRALSGSPQTDVTLDIGESHLSAAVGGVTLTTRLIEGRFPEYDNVIPHGEQANKIICGLEYLSEVVKRVSLVLEGKSNMLKIADGTLSCQSPERGAASEALVGAGEGDSEIGVNAGYLKAALDTLKGCDQCTLAWQDDMSPMTITGNGSSVLAVIMPMRI